MEFVKAHPILVVGGGIAVLAIIYLMWNSSNNVTATSNVAQAQATSATGDIAAGLSAFQSLVTAVAGAARAPTTATVSPQTPASLPMQVSQ